jgi:carboxyl-terminal processing protease
MQRSWRILLTGVALAFIIVTSFGVGVWAAPAVRHVTSTDAGPGPSIGAQFEVFWQVWNLVTDNYVDRSKINAQQMTYGAVRGMLATLDDPGHTRFLTAADYRDQENHLQGKFVGIGIVIDSRDNQLVVQDVYPNSPAAQAGMALGDVIVSINGASTAGMTPDQAVNATRGPRGSTVQLGVRHANDTAVRDLTLTREDIQLVSVRWQMLPGTPIADIAIGEFNQGTTTALRAALTDAKAHGATRFVVDVRDDPGGLLDEAVSVASLFLSSGKVLIQRDAHGHEQPYNVQAGAMDTTDPLVVLINHNTASAAEIFAAAIQDNHRGKLVGATTIGTGTVLSTYRLLDGSALLLGTAEWLTPDGQSIWKHGVAPDVDVANANGAPELRPGTLDFPATDAQVLDNKDAELVRGVQMLENVGEEQKGQG